MAYLNPDVCKTVGDKFQRQLIKLAIGSIQELSIDRKIIKKIKEENHVSDSDFFDLVATYITIVSLFMESNKEEFEEKLLSGGYSQNFIEKLPLKHENKESILATLENADQSGDSGLKYKIDVSLNNNVLNRVVPPWVVITLHNDNRDITFSVDIGTFHKLRYNVALLLKELNTLKNYNVLKK